MFREKPGRSGPGALLLLLLHLPLLGLLLLPFGYFGTDTWWLDNLGNLQLQWSFAAVVMLALTIRLPRLLLSLLFGVYALLIGIHFAPFYWPAPATADSSPLIRIAQLNLRYWNPNIDDIVADLAQRPYDVVVLQEISDESLASVSRLTDTYSHSIGSASAARFGSRHALFSRWPLTDRRVHDLGYLEGRVIDVGVVFEPADTTIRMLTLHPGAPRSDTLWQLRNSTLEFVGGLVGDSSHPWQVVVGDLNVSPWSPHWHRLLISGKLKNTARGQGYIPSWSPFYVDHPGRYLTSNYLDHSLVTEGLVTVGKVYRTVTGSDHALVETRLAIKRQPLTRLAPPVTAIRR